MAWYGRWSLQLVTKNLMERASVFTLKPIWRGLSINLFCSWKLQETLINYWLKLKLESPNLGRYVKGTDGAPAIIGNCIGLRQRLDNRNPMSAYREEFCVPLRCTCVANLRFYPNVRLSLRLIPLIFFNPIKMVRIVLIVMCTFLPYSFTDCRFVDS